MDYFEKKFEILEEKKHFEISYILLYPVYLPPFRDANFTILSLGYPSQLLGRTDTGMKLVSRRHCALPPTVNVNSRPTAKLRHIIDLVDGGPAAEAILSRRFRRWGRWSGSLKGGNKSRHRVLSWAERLSANGNYPMLRTEALRIGAVSRPHISVEAQTLTGLTSLGLDRFLGKRDND